MKTLFTTAAFVLALTGIAQAADANAPAPYCKFAEDSQRLLSIEDNISLTDEVVRLMNEAVLVADDMSVQSSTTPAFTWASETKVVCGKAYGYLQNNYRDQQTLQKCECFYQRMESYLY